MKTGFGNRSLSYPYVKATGLIWFAVRADADCESHGAVGDALAKLCVARKFRVYMMRKIVSGMTGMDYPHPLR